MSWISNLSYRSSRNVHFATILILVGLLLLGPPSISHFVGQVILDGPYSPFFKIESSVVELAAVKTVSDSLRTALVQSEWRLSISEEAAKENERLRSVLGFDPPVGYRLVPAKVVSIFGERLPLTVTINRGSTDSVEVNMPVINQVGLVGRVQDVMPDYATVQLLTHPLNRAAARVASSREMGIVRYMPYQGMVLADFPNQGAVEIGDTVLSSGLGGVYPPGLNIGTVTGVTRPENRPNSTVSLQPSVNFRTIEELFILMTEER